MKHDLKITIILLCLFLASQLVGLVILYDDIEVKVNVTTGMHETVHPETAIGPRPEIYGFDTFLWIVLSVAIGTGLVLLLMKFEKVNFWKAIFFFAVVATITIALGVFLDTLIAFVIALILALLKVFKHNTIVHNLTEIFMYAGLAVLIVPLLDITWIIALLLVISAYDAYAVWKSRHMVSMAEFQTKSKVFAGISVSYIPKKLKIVKGRAKKVIGKTKEKQKEVREAILGGGDIAFPLLFAGVVLEMLVNVSQLPKEIALMKTLLIPVFVSIALLFLFIKGKEGHYYPAMPFLTLGCLIGLGFVMIL